jgi:hypothetical protein
MSFIMQSQRGYENVSQQTNLSDLPVQNQPDRMHISPPFDEYDEHPFPDNPSPSVQSTNQLSFVDHSNFNLPKVGETRCCEFRHSPVQS